MLHECPESCCCCHLACLSTNALAYEEDFILRVGIVSVQPDGAGGAVNVDLDIDPWVYVMGLGYRF